MALRSSRTIRGFCHDVKAICFNVWGGQGGAHTPEGPKGQKGPRGPMAVPMRKAIPSGCQPRSPQIRPEASKYAKYAYLSLDLPNLPRYGQKGKKYFKICLFTPRFAQIGTFRLRLAQVQPQYAQIASFKLRFAQIRQDRPKYAKNCLFEPRLAQIRQDMPK